MMYELLLPELARTRMEDLRREAETARLAMAARRDDYTPAFYTRWVRRFFGHGKKIKTVGEICCGRATR
jgi:hypothetical protein